MKTFRTIATVLLAAFLVLGPVAAFAAGETVTVSTNAPSYSGNATISVTGTVTPPPAAAGTDVVVTTRGTVAGAVDTGTAAVAPTTGAYTYVFVAGSSQWVAGTYTVNATYGGPGGTGSATTTFTYLGTGSGNGGVITVTITTTTTSTTTVGVQTVTSTTTTTFPSSDAAALKSINGNLTSITGTLNTLSSAITQLTTSFTGISGNLAALNNVGGQLTTLTSDVNNNQTYVLVVAALAAITLVLELAILVRKLS